jgi:DNA repair protein RadA/Sms
MYSGSVIHSLIGVVFTLDIISVLWHTIKQMSNHKCSLCEAALNPNKIQCPACKYWNVTALEYSPGSSKTKHPEYITLDKVNSSKLDRIMSGPWDYVFGGGLARTSCTIIGGAPGAGKSTLFIQMADAIANAIQKEVAYIATEESLEQIKERGERLELKNLKFIGMIPAMGGLPNVADILNHHKPAAIFLDSVQGLAGNSEAIAVELCNIMKKTAVLRNAPVIISSHVNKSDEIAGLMALQHVVDATMTFFPDETGVRILEVEKNRNGRAFISTTFKMTEKGLVVLELEADKEEEMSDDYEEE